MGAKYDGGTNAICWNVDIIANEKLTHHINFCPPPWLEKIVPTVVSRLSTQLEPTWFVRT
jgi:hypothetical protein